MEHFKNGYHYVLIYIETFFFATIIIIIIMIIEGELFDVKFYVIKEAATVAVSAEAATTR